MSPAAPLVLDEGELPWAYRHPYLLTTSYLESDTFVGKPIERKEISIWKVTNASTPPQHIATLQGQLPDHPKAHFLTERFILITALDGLDYVLLIHKIEDGLLCDTKVLARGIELHPTPGDRGLIGVADSSIAVLKVGNNGDPLDMTVEVFGISEEGKFLLKSELRLLADEPLVELWVPSAYSTPILIHLSEKNFIGGLVGGSNHDVHILRWTISVPQPLRSYIQLPAIVEADEEDEEEWPWVSGYAGHVYIPSSNSLIIAHEESSAADLSPPHTTLRRINAETLDLDWCIPLKLEILGLRYDPNLSVIVMFGRDFSQFVITIIDIQTGAIRRRTGTSAWSELPRGSLTPRGELLISYSNGEVLVTKLSHVIEHGYPKDYSSESANQGLDNHIIARIPPFDPAVAATNRDTENCGMEQVEGKRGYRASLGHTGSRHWVHGAFFSDDLLILRDAQGFRYVIATWK